MSLTETLARPEDRFIAAFELNDGHTLNGSNATLQGLRREAFDRFARLGFPTQKHEAWKYTNIRAALQHDYRVQLRPEIPALTKEALAGYRIPGFDAHLVVLVNGRFSAALSEIGELPRGVVLTSLAEANEHHTELLNRYLGRYTGREEESFTALNTAFTLDGIFFYVPKNVVVEKPVQVLHLTSTAEDLFIQPRSLYILEQGSQARIVETTQTGTPSRTFTNDVAEYYVGPNAHLDLVKAQLDDEQAVRVSSSHVYQEQDSVFSVCTVMLGGALLRNNLNVLPDAENCESHLIGLYLPHGEQHMDNHTLVDHAKPNCFSNELYKGVLADRSSGVFNGKVFVRRDAQKINAFQENKSILLSTEARMNAKPELEIYADDVKCSHGATTGRLDPEAVFYLASRGLSKQAARALLLVAFARDVLDHVKVEPIRAWLDEKVRARFIR